MWKISLNIHLSKVFIKTLKSKASHFWLNAFFYYEEFKDTVLATIMRRHRHRPVTVTMTDTVTFTFTNTWRDGDGVADGDGHCDGDGDSVGDDA